MILFHPSSLGEIMAEPTAAAKKSGEILSQGAKTYLNKLAREKVYGFREKISSKPMEKGILIEDQSIELYNAVFFTDYTKNTERRSNDILTGEADIVDDDLIIDIKSSWSLATFPATPDEADNKGYEWQGRAYMMLWDKPWFELAFCMVSTPESLLSQWDDPSIHFVDHIQSNMRITKIRYARDAEIERRIVDRCRAAQQYVAEQIERINAAHRY